MIKQFTSIQEWRQFRKQLGNKTLGFVPTMGNLHVGHGDLLKRAVADNDRSLLSIYINPTQFNQASDLKNYPRTLDADLGYATELGVDYVLLPNYEELYPENYTIRVIETQLSEILEGKHRPGHFTGMLTVVLKLLMIAQANYAYFGEKDYQQLRLVEKMVNAFFLDTKIVPCPTIRETNGLAMSSRNGRLNPENRQHAAKLFALISQNKPCHEVIRELEKAGFEVEYVEDHDNRRLAAVKLQDIRLIDNVVLKTTGS